MQGNAIAQTAKPGRRFFAIAARPYAVSEGVSVFRRLLDMIDDDHVIRKLSVVSSLSPICSCIAVYRLGGAFGSSGGGGTTAPVPRNCPNCDSSGVHFSWKSHLPLSSVSSTTGLISITPDCIQAGKIGHGLIPHRQIPRTAAKKKPEGVDLGSAVLFRFWVHARHTDARKLKAPSYHDGTSIGSDLSSAFAPCLPFVFDWHARTSGLASISNRSVPAQAGASTICLPCSP